MSRKIKLLIGLLIAIIVIGGFWLYIAKVKVGADSLGKDTTTIKDAKSKIKEPNNKASLKINPNSAGELAIIIKMPDKYTNAELSDAFIGKKTQDANDKSEEINTLKYQLVKEAAQKRYDEIVKSDVVFQNDAKKMADGKKPFIDFTVTFTDSEDNIIDTNSATSNATSLNTPSNTDTANAVSFNDSSKMVLAATDSVASNFVFDSNVTQATKDIFIQYYPKIVDLIGPRMSTIPIKIRIEDMGAAGCAGSGEILISPDYATDREAIVHEMTHSFDDYFRPGTAWTEGLAIATTAVILDYKSLTIMLPNSMSKYLYDGSYGLENFNQSFLSSSVSNYFQYTYGGNLVMKLFITQKDLIKNTRAYLVNNYRHGKATGYEEFAYAFSQAAPDKIEGKSALDWLAEHYAFIPTISNEYVAMSLEPQKVLRAIYRVPKDYYGKNATFELDLVGNYYGVGVNLKVELFDMNSNKLAQCEKIYGYQTFPLYDSDCSQKFTNWDYQGIIKVRLTQNNIVYDQYITFVDGRKVNYYNNNDGDATYLDSFLYTKDDALNSNKYNLVGTTANSTATSVKIANLSTSWSTTAPIANNFFGLKDKQAYEEGNYVLTFLNASAQTVETRYLAKTEGFYSLNPVMDIANTCSIGTWSMEIGNLPSVSDYENGIVYNTNYTNSTACLNMLYKNGLPIYRGTKNAITKYFEDLLPKVQYQFELRMTNGKGYVSQTKTVVGPSFGSVKVTTLPPTDITANAVLPHGNITDTGDSSVTKRGFQITRVKGTPQADYADTGSFSVGEFAKTNISLYFSNTIYYVRAYAIDAKGTIYGDWVEFKTLSPATVPKVTTLPATSITANGVLPHGNITDAGGLAIIKRGFQITRIKGTPQADYADTGSFAAGEFTKINISLYFSNTIYYVRAYATNSRGTTYGDWVQFKTSFSLWPF